MHVYDTIVLFGLGQHVVLVPRAASALHLHSPVRTPHCNMDLFIVVALLVTGVSCACALSFSPLPVLKRKACCFCLTLAFFLLSLPQGVEGRSMEEERVKGGAAAAEPLEAEARAEARPGKRRFGAVGPPAS
jgi:hypothetical protein